MADEIATGAKRPGYGVPQKAKGGNRMAFDQLVERYQGQVRRYLHSSLSERLRGQVDADDLAQDVFFRVLRSLEDFNWQNEKAFEGWLFRIAENVIHNAVQKHRRTNESVPDHVAAQDPSPSQQMQRAERFERLESALGGLEEPYREVILLAKIERLKIRQIAERTNRSEDAVKQLLARGLRKLKKSFGDTESLHLPDRQFGDTQPSDGSHERT